MEKKKRKGMKMEINKRKKKVPKKMPKKVVKKESIKKKVRKKNKKLKKMLKEKVAKRNPKKPQPLKRNLRAKKVEEKITLKQIATVWMEVTKLYQMMIPNLGNKLPKMQVVSLGKNQIR